LDTTPHLQMLFGGTKISNVEFMKYQQGYQIVLPIQSKIHHKLQHQTFQDDADPEDRDYNQN